MSDADERHRELAEALGKVPSLSSWEDIIELVRKLRDERDELADRAAYLEGMLG